MKVSMTRALFCLALICVVGLSACSTSQSVTPDTASCACGKKTSECSCLTCKGGDGAHCECGKGAAAASKGHTHGAGHHCGGH